MNKTGILLFAHGSKDPAWKAPFQSILRETQQQFSGPVELAFLESMSPDFAAGVQALCAMGVQHIRIVPIFLATGSHMRHDLPLLIAQASREHPGVQIEAVAAIGEVAQVQQEIATYAVRHLV